jgi:hypothetical protein
MSQHDKCQESSVDDWEDAAECASLLEPSSVSKAMHSEQMTVGEVDWKDAVDRLTIGSQIW